MRTQLIALVVLVAPAVAAAEDPAAPAPEAAPEAGVAKSVTVGGVAVTGSVDAYVSVNPTRDATNGAPNELHAFDTFTNDLSFSYAEIALERPAAPVGFRIDLGFGPTADTVNATDAALGGGNDVMRHIQQAYVAWQASPKLSLRFGKMVTPFGFEVIETQANWTYTQSLLFTWAIPFTHTGIALGWAVSDRVDVTFWLTNGVNNTVDTNDFKAPAVSVAVRPAEGVTVVASYGVFNELAGAGIGDFGEALHLLDATVAWAPTAALELALNSDVGIDTAGDGDQVYWGAAAYARWHAGKRTNLALRAEYFEDSASPTLGLLPADGDLVEATATVSYAPADGLLLRAEARLDHALGDFRPFMGEDGTPGARADQFTLTFSGVAAF